MRTDELTSPVSTPSYGRVFQLTAKDVVRAPGGSLLLDGVTVSVAADEKIGIVGENGSGKSTLLRMLAGVEAPDSGEITVQAPGGVGYLGQVPDLPADGDVQDAIDHALKDLRDLEAAINDAATRMATATGDELEDLLTAYGQMLERFEARDGYAADARVDAAVHGLGLATIPRDRPIASLSGGEQARLALACVLASSPELLLLDEPTNHLDVAALTWLEKRLREHPGTVLVVSHDRVFLERTATALLEVDGDRKTVARHGGGYAGYLRRRAAERLAWEQEYRAWCEEVKRQEELAATVNARLAEGPRPDAERGQRHQRNVEKQISSRVRNAGERLNRLHAEAVPPPPQPLRFTGRAATATSAGSAVLIEAEGVVVRDRLEVDRLTLTPGTRLLITGANGAGKSTLLRVLAGDLRPDRGTVRRHGARIGWLPQELAEARPGQTLLGAFAASMPGPAAEHREALLSLGLFRPEDLDTPADGLSIGQRRRLALARLLRMPADVLLLDEPTNHLSPGLVEDLEVALAEYQGALVIVSHDRMMNERFAGDRVEMHGGRFTAPQ
jgi:macrolide transport system ATP-binding/permease protein